jgi:hypothetical protein
LLGQPVHDNFAGRFRPASAPACALDESVDGAKFRQKQIARNIEPDLHSLSCYHWCRYLSIPAEDTLHQPVALRSIIIKETTVHKNGIQINERAIKRNRPVDGVTNGQDPSSRLRRLAHNLRAELAIQGHAKGDPPPHPDRYVGPPSFHCCEAKAVAQEMSRRSRERGRHDYEWHLRNLQPARDDQRGLERALGVEGMNLIENQKASGDGACRDVSMADAERQRGAHVGTDHLINRGHDGIGVEQHTLRPPAVLSRYAEVGSYTIS